MNKMSPEEALEIWNLLGPTMKKEDKVALANELRKAVGFDYMKDNSNEEV